MIGYYFVNIRIKVLLIVVFAIVFVSNIDAGWRDQWVWFKSFFSGFSIKRPSLTKRQMVVGGVGALAVVGAAWWWFNKPSKKGPIQKNDSPKKEINTKTSNFNNDQPLQSVVQDSKESSDISKGIQPDSKSDQDKDKEKDTLLSKEEIIPKEEDIPQETQNPDLSINKSSIQEKKNIEEEEKIAQRYQQINQTVDIKKAIQNFQTLLNSYEKKDNLTALEINELKTKFEELNFNIPKDQKLLWKRIANRYDNLIKK